MTPAAWRFQLIRDALCLYALFINDGFYVGWLYLNCQAILQKKKPMIGGVSAVLHPLQSSEQPNIHTVAIGTPQSIGYP